MLFFAKNQDYSVKKLLHKKNSVLNSLLLRCRDVVQPGRAHAWGA